MERDTTFNATIAKRDLQELFYEGYGTEKKQIEHNKKLALKALKIIVTGKRKLILIYDLR